MLLRSDSADFPEGEGVLKELALGSKGTRVSMGLSAKILALLWLSVNFFQLWLTKKLKIKYY